MKGRPLSVEPVRYDIKVRRFSPFIVSAESVGDQIGILDDSRRHGIDEEGHVRNEGDIQVGPGGPYPISYGSIIPKKEDCTNLFVPVAVSASHIAYGSIRMEPVFMILGQSAATAAAISASVTTRMPRR
jgi:hypothetical protein